MYKKNNTCEHFVPIMDFNPIGSEFETLGDKILKAMNYGADIGNTINVDYDADDINGVDVLASPNHDFFDIAEEFGELVESQAVPIDSKPNE